jgi:hypothetical protein
MDTIPLEGINVPPPDFGRHISRYVADGMGRLERGREADESVQKCMGMWDDL